MVAFIVGAFDLTVQLDESRNTGSTISGFLLGIMLVFGGGAPADRT